ncbi:hypothetical protein [Glaciimonas immobilis]|uniref:Uncharacterized protein n=1 Tax=Glaciimonas immobilis TaxID=728004 RepID=A0A840RNH6_9BURK|nr:hypothetical protein [Glaciimonas immobilis]KAF3999067.1 hypothetical protein HAV38_03740 [Glaciimonas immobilis]MBB5198498.1 hypothetical protein [Glaciimonas immobilis]
MPHSVGFVDNSVELAHYAMLQVLHDFASAHGWEVLRYDTEAANRELILKGIGLSGAEEIFVGFRTYQNEGKDYYNLVAAVFTGYVPGNTFDTQPGVRLSGVPAHNNRIDYWLSVNGQRIAFALKVGTPVYMSAYVGKFLPYASPGQYPYPVICAGMLKGVPETRFSETGMLMPYKGVQGNNANFYMRFVDGAWRTPWTYPWNGTPNWLGNAGDRDKTLRDTGGVYPLVPVVLFDGVNVYGELDGIFFISGFNNAVENTTTVNGVKHVVIEDAHRTGFVDYYALRLDH